ncbi:MAG TPA: AAA family ATPase [Mycobacteriales bacterium]|nr:AAA family ATPase [Mycobacteriales bacterium]
MTDQLTVVVLDRSDALIKGLAKAVAALPDEPDVQVFDRPAEVDAAFAAGPVDVLVVGPSELTAAGMRRVAKLHAEHPETVVVVAGKVAELPSPMLLVKAGAAEIIRLPAGPATIRKALESATAQARGRHVEVVVERAVEVTAAPEPEPEQPVQREPAVTITVASATGGCGKTFLASNLAYLLARTGKRVAMVDLDLQFGEVVSMLQLRPAFTIVDVDPDQEGSLEACMTPHKGGFDVLAAPRDPIAADGLTPERIAEILLAIRQRYDYLIIDTPPSLNEVVLSSFDISEHLIVLATLDVPSVNNMRVFLSTLDRLKIPTEGIHLVLNKAEKGVGLAGSDVEALLGRPWDLVLPYDREVSRAVNLGLPVTEAAPGTEVSRRLVRGLSAVVPGAAVVPAIPEQRNGLVARLLGSLAPRRAVAAVAQEEKS